MLPDNLLNLDYLKSIGTKPAWFGLGFIQLEIDEERRMHFWHPSLKPDDNSYNEEYHDHRYRFTSEVLLGDITNEIVHISDGGAFGMWRVCCHGLNPPFYVTNVEILGYHSFTISAGGHYTLSEDVFHRSIATRCVTVVTKSKPTKNAANVISKQKPTNPFLKEYSEDQLWEYISELLPAPKPIGYHLSTIPKGVLGEYSKILEETQEFADACLQDARIMQLVELSDVVGAMEAYLTKHFPGVDLNDLKVMSELTKRAFESGQRK